MPTASRRRHRLHACLPNPAHEAARRREIAREIGFTQVSVSHEVSPLMKLVGRGDTTVVDAYLSPILRATSTRSPSELGARPRAGRLPTADVHACRTAG
jgi:N-methylhydantoinase A/oxoprolinase/acetone carboxylase beta subunit